MGQTGGEGRQRGMRWVQRAAPSPRACLRSNKQHRQQVEARATSSPWLPGACCRVARASSQPALQDCGKPFYINNYLLFFGAIRARYPHLALISNCHMGQDAPTDTWDWCALVCVWGAPTDAWDWCVWCVCGAPTDTRDWCAWCVCGAPTDTWDWCAWCVCVRAPEARGMF